MKTIEVVAAVIIKDDKILVTQRGYGDFKGKWEFPGGKIENNESKENALIREIKEEMNADINVEKYLTTVDYDYENFHLTMHTYICSLKNNFEMVQHGDNEFEHDAMIWVSKDELDNVDFLPADILIVNRLK